MTRKLSLNARQYHDDQNSDDIEVVLFMFSHPDLDAPIRISTDPTERISTDPLMYGTRSPWQTEDPDADPFLFLLVSATLPDDLEDAPASASITLELFDTEILAVLRSITDFATVDVAVVMASTLDVLEAQFLGLKMGSFEADSAEVTINFSRQPIEEESFPTDRMTKQRFPGLHP